MMNNLIRKQNRTGDYYTTINPSYEEECIIKYTVKSKGEYSTKEELAVYFPTKDDNHIFARLNKASNIEIYQPTSNISPFYKSEIQVMFDGETKIPFIECKKIIKERYSDPPINNSEKEFLKSRLLKLKQEDKNTSDITDRL